MTPPAPVTLAEILTMHELLLERFGGMRGVTEHGFGKIEAAVAAPEASMFGEELYPDPVSKAGTLFFQLARAHGFSDGNKRIALVALLDLLERNGLSLVATEDDLFEFVMAAACDSTREDVTAWIEAHVRAG